MCQRHLPNIEGRYFKLYVKRSQRYQGRGPTPTVQGVLDDLHLGYTNKPTFLYNLGCDRKVYQLNFFRIITFVGDCGACVFRLVAGRFKQAICSRHKLGITLEKRKKNYIIAKRFNSDNLRPRTKYLPITVGKYSSPPGASSTSLSRILLQ